MVWINVKRREHVKVVAIDFSCFPFSISLFQIRIRYVSYYYTSYYKYVFIVLVIKRNWSLSWTVERKTCVSLKT